MDREDLKITASLAMLELAETERIHKAFSEMLDYFSKMMEVDIENLEPTTHAILKDNRVRDDVVTQNESPDALLDCAPEREDRFIKLPSVL